MIAQITVFDGYSNMIVQITVFDGAKQAEETSYRENIIIIFFFLI